MAILVSRRSLLRQGAALGALSALATPAIIRTAYGQSTADIGNILSMSGNFANVSKLLNEGTQAAIDTRGSESVKFSNVVLDDQGDAARAVSRVREAVEQSKTSLFVNGTLSPIALAVARELTGPKAVYVNGSGADEMTGSACNRSTFRYNSTTHSMAELAVRRLAAEYPDAKRWYTIAGQYVFSESLLSNCKRIFGEIGVEHVGNTFHSLSEKEYSGYFPAILAAKPDVLVIANYAGQTTDVLRQAVSFGLKNRMRILVLWATGLDQFQALGPDVIENVYFGSPYWHEVESPANTAFVKFMRERHGKAPNYVQAAGYFAAKLLMDGVVKANSLEVAEVIKAMEGMSFEGATGSETIRAGDHQVIKDGYFMVGKSKDAMRNPDDFVSVLASGRDFIPLKASGCKMV